MVVPSPPPPPPPRQTQHNTVMSYNPQLAACEMASSLHQLITKLFHLHNSIPMQGETKYAEIGMYQKKAHSEDNKTTNGHKNVYTKKNKMKHTTLRKRREIEKYILKEQFYSKTTSSLALSTVCAHLALM